MFTCVYQYLTACVIGTLRSEVTCLLTGQNLFIFWTALSLDGSLMCKCLISFVIFSYVNLLHQYFSGFLIFDFVFVSLTVQPKWRTRQMATKDLVLHFVMNWKNLIEIMMDWCGDNQDWIFFFKQHSSRAHPEFPRSIFASSAW